ncbi:MFS transporter [Rhodococcus sp. NPDC057529]|uniref:MFS transporter n=1 Tax=Rhodococcus sp. NPDC057529 TaxID=3346158 RepID=UPI00366E1A59
MTNRVATASRLGAQERRALFSGTLGNAIEYYEFSIYGLTAAVVFNKLFFPNAGGLTGTVLSLGTFLIAFIARPVGGIVFGHFGDRLGRKGTLIVSLVMMGGATTAIGLLPTYGQIGMWAPILLVVMRLIQGVSMGGEYSGSLLMVLEHARVNRRTLIGAVVSSGLAWGTLAGNGFFLLVSQLPEDAFVSWGWRIPFLSSGVLVTVCLYIRMRIDETPEFAAAVEQAEASDEKIRTPLVEVLRKHKMSTLLVILILPGMGLTYYLATVFSLVYANQVGLDRSHVITGIIVAQVILGVGMPLFGWLADATGRRRLILISGFIGIAVAGWIWLALLSTNNPIWITVGFAILFIPYSAAYATFPATAAHAFPAIARFTGLALAYNVGSLALSATSPLIALALFENYGTWASTAVYLSGGALVSMLAAVAIKERYIANETDVEQTLARAANSEVPVGSEFR